MDIAEYQRQRDDGYRAIGRYIVAFSQLMHQLRMLMTERLSRPAERNIGLVEMLLGEAPPKLIIDSFFGMCRMVGELDNNEKAIEKNLRKQAGDASLMRNDVAHGDWFVGLLEGFDAAKVQDPVLVRIKPGRVEGHPEKAIDLAVQDLDAMADALADLTNTCIEFGRLAFGLPVLQQAGEIPGEWDITMGKLRVSDIYALEGTNKAPEGIRVTRTGPFADQSPYVRWVSPKRAILPDDVLAKKLLGE